MSEKEYNSLIQEIKQIAWWQSSKFLGFKCDFNLSDNLFLLEFETKTDWDYISYYYKLSELFIEKYQNFLNWNHLSRRSKLSETLVEKCQNKITWDRIIYNKNAKISNGFLLQQYLYNYDSIFIVLRNKDGLIRYANKIEREISTLLLEID